MKRPWWWWLNPWRYALAIEDVLVIVEYRCPKCGHDSR